MYIDDCVSVCVCVLYNRLNIKTYQIYQTPRQVVAQQNSENRLWVPQRYRRLGDQAPEWPWAKPVNLCSRGVVSWMPLCSDPSFLTSWVCEERIVMHIFIFIFLQHRNRVAFWDAVLVSNKFHEFTVSIILDSVQVLLTFTVKIQCIKIPCNNNCADAVQYCILLV